MHQIVAYQTLTLYDHMRIGQCLHGIATTSVRTGFAMTWEGDCTQWKFLHRRAEVVAPYGEGTFHCRRMRRRGVPSAKRKTVRTNKYVRTR